MALERIAWALPWGAVTVIKVVIEGRGRDDKIRVVGKGVPIAFGFREKKFALGRVVLMP